MIYWLLGYRKRSLLGDVSPRDISPVFSKVPVKTLNDKDEIDLSGGHEINQGRVGACACCTLCSIVQDIIIRDTRDKTIEIDWDLAWDTMKIMGIASDDKGSYLEDNLWYGQNIGYKDNKGKTWKLDKIEKISRNDMEKYIRMGYQIYTGAMVDSPMCTRDWVFRTGGRKYGHAFRLIGVSIWQKVKRFLAETTWKNYAHKRESQFFVNKEDVNRLFTCCVVTIKKV